MWTAGHAALETLWRSLTHTNLVQCNTYDQPGGHYAAHLFLDVLTEDIRQFFVKRR